MDSESSPECYKQTRILKVILGDNPTEDNSPGDNTPTENTPPPGDTPPRLGVLTLTDQRGSNYLKTDTNPYSWP